MKKILSLVVIIVCVTSVIFANAATSDYLILNNIGIYSISTPQAVFEGRPPVGGPQISDGAGILSGTDHFPDHPDKSYKVRYIGANDNPSPKVEVTQHTGGDSDRWLLHEIEDSYRDVDDKDGRLGLLAQGTRIREINGKKIIGLRGDGYTWVSNNVVVDISYTDLDGTKPEPLEIVQAYLAKFPSTITTTDAVFKNNDYNVKWIKDEIDRRLWLCDKWNAQFQAGKTTQKDLLDNLVSNMEVFLNYREKYFSDIKAVDEISALYALQKNNDATSIQKKLTDYKTWWNANKTKAITLP